MKSLLCIRFIELNPLKLRAGATYTINLNVREIIVSLKLIICVNKIITMLKK